MTLVRRYLKYLWWHLHLPEQGHPSNHPAGLRRTERAGRG